MDEDYRRNDRVVAVCEVGYGEDVVAPGTWGTIVAVHCHYYALADYDVLFDNNVFVCGVSRDDLYPERWPTD